LIEVEGDGFLYKMVRTIVGTLVRIGRAVKPEPWAAEVLASKSRSAAGITAPARGLFLQSVTYDDCRLATGDDTIRNCSTGVA
jgi:tRNA pseudouridine38-40 synthase